MGSEPRVTVVIPTLNRATKLERALESVLRQAYQDFEVIVVDNASEDGTQSVVRGFSDERVRYIRFSENRGAQVARNTGIKEAKGAFVAFLDDDDEWRKEKLSRQVQAFAEGTDTLGLVYVGSEVFNEKENCVETVNIPQYKGNVYERLLLSTILGSVSSAMVKAECFQKVGLFDEALSSCQDWDMWLRIAREYEFDFVPETLARINFHGEQISTDYGAMIPGRSRMVEKHRSEFAQYPDVFVVHLKRVGKLHCINGTWGEARLWFADAVRVNAWEIVKIGAWCLLELPRLKLFSREKNFKRYVKGKN